MSLSRVLVGALLGYATTADAQDPRSYVVNRYEIDSQHSTIGFTTRILGAVKVRGRFRDYSGSIMYDPSAPERSSVSALMRATSIDTDMDFRDRHLRSPDFFDVEHFPTISFTSERVERRGTGYVAVGPLTMHGVRRTVELPLQLMLAPDTDRESGSVRVAIESHLRISRADYGIAATNKFNPSYDPAATMLADSVDVDLELFAIKPGHLNRTFVTGNPRSIADTLSKLVAAGKSGDVSTVYAQLKRDQPSSFNFSAGQLDALGKQLLERGHVRDGVLVLSVNDNAFATTPGVATSLADALLTSGDLPHAIATYRRALAVDSLDMAARETLRRINPR